MIAVIAALPREIAGLVGRQRPDASLKRQGVYLYRLPRAMVVCAGMGSSRAVEAVRAARSSGEITKLVSVGLAGGCDPSVAVGDVVEPGVIVDVLSGERFSIAGGHGVLVTTHTIAGVEEKSRLFKTYGAAAVDMEATAVGRMAEIHGVPFGAIKAVSDGHDFELATLSRFAGAGGQFHTGRFALHTALRPVTWRGAMQLGAGSQRALRNLTAVLREMCYE